MKRAVQFLVVIMVMSLIISCASSSKWTSLNVPQDPNYLFATGQAQSQQMNLAMEKAGLNARTEIARQIESRLQSLQKSFVEEIGSGADSDLLDYYLRATKSVTSQIQNGAGIREQKYRELDDGSYEAMVLVEYPIGAANAALVNQLKQQKSMYTRFRASEAFKELEQEAQKFEEYKKSQNTM